MTKWPVQKLAQGTTQKLLQHHYGTSIKIGSMLFTQYSEWHPCKQCYICEETGTFLGRMSKCMVENNKKTPYIYSTNYLY